MASTITKITTVGQLLSYLQEHHRDVAEYLAEGEMHAELIWDGEGAAAVGLVGVADIEDVSRVMRGVDPEDLDSDRIVVRLPPAGAKNPRPMSFEVSLGPPKSVSVLWAIGDDEIRKKIDACHERAIAAALRALEERVPYARVRAGDGQRRWVRGDGLLVGRVRHESSRSGDPQLHTHLLVMNVVCVEGRWRAIDSQKLYDGRCRANNEYARTLQIELVRELGVEWTAPTGRNLIREIAGVPTELTDFMSKRHAEIEDAVAEHAKRSGVHGGGGARRIAATRTRDTKDLSETRAAKRVRWRAESLAVLASVAARRRQAPEVTVAAFVAAALWREAGGDVDRFGVAVRAAEAMTEVPEFGASAARGAVAAAGQGGAADEAAVALGVLRSALPVPEGRTVDEAYDAAELARIADEAARATGLSLDEFAGRALRGNTVAQWDRQAAAEAAQAMLTEYDTYWDYDHLLEVLEQVAPDATCDEIRGLANEILASDQIVGIAVACAGGDADGNDREPGWERWATRATIEREQRVLDQITAGANHQWRDFGDIERAEARERCAAAGLSDEQTEAALGLAGRLVGVLTADGPGAGKTATMAGLRLLAHKDQSVVGLAVGEKAARQLAKSAGFTTANIAQALTDANAIHRSRNHDERQKRHELSQTTLPNGGCWVIDEASMVSTTRLDHLFALANQRGAQIVLCGDAGQLDPISGGAGVFAAAVARPEIPTERLTEIHRPRDPWEASAWKRLTDGEAGALDEFAAHGRFLGAGNPAEAGDNDTNAISQIVAMWTAATAEAAPTIDDDTPEGVRRVAERRAAKLDDDRRRIAAEERRRIAAEESGALKRRRRQRRLGEADGRLAPLAVAFTNADVDKLNDAIRDAANPPPPAKPRRGRPRKRGREVTEVRWADQDGDEHTWRFRVGDTVMTTLNDKTIRTNKGHTIANSQRWRLTAIIGDRLRLESIEGYGNVDLPARYWSSGRQDTGRPLLQLGYAATLYKAQGATADLSLCLDSHHINRPGLLVALTRARWGGFLVAEGDDRDALAAAQAAHRRPGNLTAAVEAHRLGLEAGGIIPEAPTGIDI